MIRLPDIWVQNSSEYQKEVDHWNIGLVWYSDDKCAYYSNQACANLVPKEAYFDNANFRNWVGSKILIQYLQLFKYALAV